LRSYEIESLVKSFLLYFLLIASIYLLIAWQNDTAQRRNLDNRILQEMKIFAFDPTSRVFHVDFVPPDPASPPRPTLYHDTEGVYGIFRVPTEDAYRMKVLLPAKAYDARLETVRQKAMRGMVLYLVLIAIISLLLAYYALQPIRRALRLNKEFMRDILHDVNTPLASIAVNLKLLKKRHGEDASLARIANNVETIALLRENLHAYLGDQAEPERTFDLAQLLEGRLEYFRALYPHLTFQSRVPEGVEIHTRYGACVRIVDNLIGNAAKYNVDHGTVTVTLEGERLVIADTGRGIRNVRKVFRRHYREGERGMGLGLHIVHTLCKKLRIRIALRSEVGQGTTVSLDCSAVMQK